MTSTLKPQTVNLTDNAKKSILARGCDPVMSAYAAKVIPPQTGNPEYVFTTNDADFLEKLSSRQWSVVFFAPDACRYSAAKQQIPGGNKQTEGWTLEQYKALVKKLQGDDIEIVEALSENETIGLLKTALSEARETR